MQTAQNFNVKDVSGDKAYSSRANLELINELGAVPYIPFKKGTTGRAKNAPTWKKMYHYFEFKNEEFLEHYHKLSNAETTFHMIKSKFGDSVRSKTEVAQVNEVLLKGCATISASLFRRCSSWGLSRAFSRPDALFCSINSLKIGENYGTTSMVCQRIR